MMPPLHLPPRHLPVLQLGAFSHRINVLLPAAEGYSRAAPTDFSASSEERSTSVI
jgi:hypothetical protein